MKQKQHIGTIAADRLVVIERGLVERFVDALDLNDPVSTDAQSATEAGLRDLMLPNIAAASLGDFQRIIELLELRPKQVLHSKESVTVLAPICVGDELRIITRISDLYEQQVGGNPMGFVVIECLGSDGSNEIIFESKRVLAVRGGFPRR